MKRRPVAEQMLKALVELGPMTCKELCDHIKTPKCSSGSVISRLMRQSPNRPKRVHIVDWTEDSEGTRRYIRPIYKAGKGADKPKPPTIERQKINRVRYTRSKLMRVSSIWDLAKTVKERLAA